MGFASLARAGKTYRLRVSNVGLQNTLNVMIQDHSMTLVEVEGTHTVQNSYTSLDVHVGQSLSVLFAADRPARDYHVVVSTRFANATLRSTAVVRYAGSSGPAFGSLPAGPGDVESSLDQARSIRLLRTCLSFSLSVSSDKFRLAFSLSVSSDKFRLLN